LQSILVVLSVQHCSNLVALRAIPALQEFQAASVRQVMISCASKTRKLNSSAQGVLALSCYAIRHKSSSISFTRYQLHSVPRRFHAGYLPISLINLTPQSTFGALNASNSKPFKPLAHTERAQSAIQSIAKNVKKDINAQVQITSQFGSQASTAIGKYAAAQMKDATDLRIRASKLPAGEQRDRLNNEAKAIEANWGDQGILRLGAHTVVGGLTGGAGGAAGTLAGTVAAPVLQEQLAAAGITGTLSNILVGIGSTAVGGAVGGTAGAAGALNEVQNNYLTPRENLARNKAASACSGSNYTDSKACGEANRLNELDKKRDTQISTAVAACQTSQNPQTCIDASRMVNQLQNQGMQELQQLAKELAPSCAPPRDCTQAANWGRGELSTLYTTNNQLWPSISSEAVQSTMGPVELAVGGVATVPRAALGFTVGAGFDAAGQYYQNGTVRPVQSAFAGLTAVGGAATVLRTPSQYLIYAAPVTGAGASGINTTFNNVFYTEDTSVLAAGGLGGLFGVAGPVAGAITQRFTAPFITNAPRIPLTGPAYILSTPPRLPNLPGYVGNAVNNTVSNIPSFIRLDDGKSKQGEKP
jgi:hypothetical protein